MLVVTAHTRCRPDARRAFIDAAGLLIAVSRDEPGCLDYSLLEVVDEPNHFVCFEHWQDDAALEAHLGSAALASYRAAVADLIDSRWATVHQSTAFRLNPSPKE